MLVQIPEPTTLSYPARCHLMPPIQPVIDFVFLYTMTQYEAVAMQIEHVQLIHLPSDCVEFTSDASTLSCHPFWSDPSFFFFFADIVQLARLVRCISSVAISSSVPLWLATDIHSFFNRQLYALSSSDSRHQLLTSSDGIHRHNHHNRNDYSASRGHLCSLFSV